MVPPGTYPNGPGQTATFGSLVSSPPSITVTNDINPTLGTLNFANSAVSYTLTGGTVTMNNSNMGAAVNVNSGSHFISSNLALTDTSGTTFTVANSASLSVSGGITNSSGAGTTFTVGSSGSLSLTGGVNNGGNLLTFSGAGNTTVGTTGISGGGGLTYSGPGTLTLASTNTYGGPTQVNGGTLRVSGSLNAASAVTVGGASASGTPTLTGSGSIPGTVTIASGDSGAAGHLAPSGISGAASNMTLSGGLTLADGATSGSGAVLDFNVPAIGTGDLVTTSSLYLGTNGVLNINPFGGGGALTTGDYPLIDFSSLTSSDNSLTWSVSNTGGDSGHNYSFMISPGSGPGGSSQFELVVSTSVANGSSSWVLNSSSGGAYGNSGNWNQQTIPSGAGQSATFVNSSVTALTQTVTIDSTYTVGTLDFTSGTNFKLQSSGSGPSYSLTLNNNGAGASESDEQLHDATHVARAGRRLGHDDLQRRSQQLFVRCLLQRHRPGHLRLRTGDHARRRRHDGIGLAEHLLRRHQRPSRHAANRRRREASPARRFRFRPAPHCYWPARPPRCPAPRISPTARAAAPMATSC